MYFVCLLKINRLSVIFSDRKRMSVILRTPEGEIKLLIKGAVSFGYVIQVGDVFCYLGYGDL